MSRQCFTVLTTLRGAGMVGMTTFELFQATGLCDPIRRVRELRSKGFVIDHYERRSQKGARVVRYILRDEPALGV